MRDVRSRDPNRTLHRIFETSLALKGAFALAEFVLGLALFLVDADALAAAVRALTAHEIAQDPTDPLARLLLAELGGLTVGMGHFYALYLLSHGALKLAVIGLLARGALWAYPLGIAVLAGFVAYQVVLMMTRVTPGLVLLSLLDLAVIALTLHEWRQRRRRL